MEEDGRGGQEPGADKDVRIEGVVVDEEAREAIRRAAEAAGTSIRQFVGRAALAAASGEGAQLARLEHLAEIQGELMGQLAELRDGLESIAATTEKMLAHHVETQDRVLEMLGPVLETCRTVTTGLAVINRLAGGLAANGYACELLARLCQHLGVDPGEPPPGCGDRLDDVHPPRGGGTA